MTQYTAEWRVLGSSPPCGMSVGAPTVLFAPARRSILPRAVGEDLTWPTRGPGPRKYPAGGPPPPLLLPPPQAQHLRERPCLLKPLAPTISSLVQSNGRPYGRPGRPTSPLPCTNPIPPGPPCRWLAVWPSDNSVHCRVACPGFVSPSRHVSRRSDSAFCALPLSF